MTFFFSRNSMEHPARRSSNVSQQQRLLPRPQPLPPVHIFFPPTLCPNLLQNIQRQLRFVPWFVDKKHDWQNKPSRNIHKRKTAQQTTTYISICAEPADKRKSKIKGKQFTMARNYLCTRPENKATPGIKCSPMWWRHTVSANWWSQDVRNGRPAIGGGWNPVRRIVVAPWNLRHFRHTLSQITFEKSRKVAS